MYPLKEKKRTEMEREREREKERKQTRMNGNVLTLFSISYEAYLYHERIMVE